VNEARTRRLLRRAGVVLTTAFCLGPIAYMVWTAFRAPPRPGPGGASFTLEHVRAVLLTRSLHFPAYLRNSLLVSALSAGISVAIASAAAYALTRLSLRGKGLLLMAVLAVSMFPPVSLVSCLYRLMSALGWVNSYQALILPYVAWTLPLSLWILVSHFAGIPRDLDRTARVDGCTRLQALFRVILPVAAPGVVSAALLAFVFSFSEFLLALMLTTDPAARTVPVGIALFEGLHGEMPWGEIMAAATVTTLPVLLLTLIFQRRILQGLTRGAVKG
jgi:trehalose/maltose transport system permease protein